ncbi:MAG: alpha-hydroxy-acid oxidizing protein [Microbacteriaceae bacterium]|nr:alpha-hydroxy-acid oxidizing protein [Microbacteriaceae bacterium]
MDRPFLSSVSLAGLERIASEIIPDDAYAYYMTGARDEITLRANVAAWSSWYLAPLLLTDTRELTMETTVLGASVGSPVMIAPMAAQTLAHPDGELATVRAASAGGHVVVLSMNASMPVEQLAAEPGAHVWLQLYLSSRDEVTANLVERARAAGAEALVVTVDAVVESPTTHRRPHGPIGLPSALSFPMNDGTPLDDGITWATIERFVAEAGLPVVLKGILRPDDARRAADLGCAGIVVSNHGGRQVDGTIATAEALADVADAVADRLEVYVDGGIRRGTDVLRALALGARAVLVGRPVLWGLAAAGQAGVARVLELLDSELHQDARQCGVTDLRAVPRDLVRLSTTIGGSLPPILPVRGR